MTTRLAGNRTDPAPRHGDPRDLDIVLTGPGQVDVGRVVDATAPLGPDDALVEVDRVSLCGSDRALFSGTYGGPRSYPIRFGHEWAGRVIATGASARSLLGADVTGDCSRWCGSCDRCRSDRNLCRHIEKFGLTVDGFSTRRRSVPSRYLYVDPYRLDPGLRALAEPFAVGLRGLRRVLHSGPSGGVLIVGGGPIGVVCYLLATRHFDVAQVHIAESDPVRAEWLRRLLPEATVFTPEVNAGDTYQAVAATARYPVVVESAGSATALDTALALADLGGQVLCLGLGAAAASQLRLIVLKGLRVVGSIGGTGAFPDALGFLCRYSVDAARLITSRYPASQAHAAFAAALADHTQLKPQLVFEGSPHA